MSTPTLRLALAFLLCWSGVAAAQEGPEAPAAPEAASPAPEVVTQAQLEQKFAELRAELDALKKDVAEDDEDDLLGWQLQLRGAWHTVFKNHHDNTFKRDDHQHGWGIGLGLMVPLWPELGPLDLYGHLAIEYRQLAYSTVYTAPITGAKGTISYVDITAAPALRFSINDMLTPYAFTGFVIQVASPPDDAISYLDLGLTVGAGLDIKVHERISFGLEYKLTWFGVADQEEEDYGQATGYVGFNF